MSTPWPLDQDRHAPDSTPTADAAERWLRTPPTPLADQVERWLWEVAPLPAPVAAFDDDDLALAEGRTAVAPHRPDIARTTLALTGCRAWYARPNREGRRCPHTHIEILVREEREPEWGEARYSLRVVNVDLPPCRHAEAFIAPDRRWRSREGAITAAFGLARERWGAAIVAVHVTPAPSRT